MQLLPLNMQKEQTMVVTVVRSWFEKTNYPVTHAFQIRSRGRKLVAIVIGEEISPQTNVVDILLRPCSCVHKHLF
jgi:hypothetical protein